MSYFSTGSAFQAATKTDKKRAKKDDEGADKKRVRGKKSKPKSKAVKKRG